MVGPSAIKNNVAFPIQLVEIKEYLLAAVFAEANDMAFVYDEWSVGVVYGRS